MEKIISFLKSKHVKTWLWQVGTLCLYSSLTIIIDKLPNLELPEFISVIILYMLNGYTKYLNKNYLQKIK